MTTTTSKPKHLGLLTVCIMLATIMQALDTTIANVALPYMQGSLSATVDQINWVLTSYIVAAAIATPVTGFLECADLREHVDLLVTDELGAKACALRELGRTLVVFRDRSTRACPLLLHQPRELLFVDTESSLVRELAGQLEWEAVRVM